MSAPRVSIGLPVYNGEAFLGEAIEALLNQTFTDLELVICDNASTDGTEEVSRKYVEADSRVRYYRNDANLGAAPNFNRAYHESSGEYFKWSAADDLYVPEFLASSVAVLDAEPDVVLVYPLSVDIDDVGATIHEWGSMARAATGDPATRFADVVDNERRAFPIFGLTRRDALAQTSLIRSYTGSDYIVLAELALLGRFVELPEVQFLHREHLGRSTREFPNFRDRATWFDTSLRGPSFPYWALSMDFARASVRYPIGNRNRLRCLATSSAWSYSWKGRLWREAWWGLQDLLRRND